MPSINLVLDLIPRATDPEQREPERCPGCLDELTIHQPDIDLPDRLIGVCKACRGWFLIDAGAGVIVRLPDRNALRDP